MFNKHLTPSNDTNATHRDPPSAVPSAVMLGAREPHGAAFVENPRGDDRASID